jgi:hypothetical protein
MIYDMLTGAPPFTGSNRKKIMEAVLRKKPFFPKYMTVASRDICTKVMLRSTIAIEEDAASPTRKRK